MWVLQIRGSVEMPSSSMVCRLLTELPVASEEFLWDVCSKKQQENQERETNKDLDMRVFSDPDLQLQFFFSFFCLGAPGNQVYKVLS